ncbi:SpaA isopeptide-forming pilin-related protein [Enterococcus faecalis]|uniref:SpaA isopeptide-forming pilin-related protein n=1 Tax=Enterococcus faecalis TaxID=1351 RepID=UPI0035CA52AC
MNKKNNQAAALLSLLTMLAAFFVAPMTSEAATVNYTKVADYISTWYIKAENGLHWTDEGIYLIKADNEPVFCIEHSVIINGGSGFTPSEMTSAEKERLSLIAYYGYQLNPTVENYGVTQHIIWQEYGDTLISTQIPNYEQRKAEILSKVDRHRTKPSFQDQTIELNVGESVTLTDSANVLDSYKHLLENSANLKVEKHGNQLKLTATADSKETGKLQYGIASAENIGQSFVYYKPGEQKVAKFRLSNAGEMNVNIKVNLNGNVQIKKVDEDTGKAVPDTKMKAEYNGQTKELITDKNGLASLNDIKAGTKIKISEVQASNGYVNSGEVKEVTVEPNKTIEVTFKNKTQQGLLKLKKTGQKAVSVKEQESEYGPLYQMVFDYVPLANVTFDIRAVEDIKVGDHVHAKAGSVVATVKTNDKGELIDMPRLYLGKYETVEKAAPNGFILNKTPIPFAFTYSGQEVELVSQSVEAKNEFQKVNLEIYKNEEIIQEWVENEPVIEAIPANEKTFGLFTNQEFSLADGTKLASDALLGFGTIQEGSFSFEQLQLPEGQYYVKELDAAETHDLDETHYEFEFKASDHEQEKTIQIYGEPNENEESSPILNKLHLNRFVLKKVNEEATLKELNGYEFTFTGNAEGAVFTLEDEEKQVFQTVMVNEQSLAIFENIPVGTFFLKEQKTSSDKYVLSSEVYTIVSTKEGIEIFSSEDELLGSTIPTPEEIQEEDSEQEEEQEKGTRSPVGEVIDESEEEVTILLEIKNHLVKGDAELTKKDVLTGQTLPDTGVRILDKDKKVVIEGRTDGQGTFTFEQLPAGQYYFQEFDAPAGYQLDETPVAFEIKEHGEIVKCEMTNEMIPKEPVKEKEPIKTTETLPQTGETMNMAMTVLGGLLLAAGATVFIYLRKSKKNK